MWCNRSEELIKELEQELHEHGKRSAIKHGRIDVAHARKKKRLDEDLESAMESIEARRSDVLALDERLAELLEQRQDKEDEMKVRHRKSWAGCAGLDGSINPITTTFEPMYLSRSWSILLLATRSWNASLWRCWWSSRRSCCTR